MKRAWIAAALLIVTAVCCAHTLGHFERVCCGLIDHAEAMTRAVEAGDGEKALLSLGELRELWHRERGFFFLLSGGDSCEQLEESLVQVEVWALQKDKSPETLSELSNLMLNVRLLLQSQKPALLNLF